MDKIKTDCTYGNSKILPETYKRDVSVQVWIQSRYLASLDKWILRNGEYNKYLSDIVNNAVEALVMHLIDLNEIELVDDSVEARDYLTMRFHVNLNRNDRKSNNTRHNAQLTENRRNLGGVIKLRHERISPYTPLMEKEGISELSEDAINSGQKAIETYKMLEEQQRKESLEKQKLAAYASPRCIKLENECSGKDIGGGILIDKDELMQRARANDEALKNF